jgi:hypothetical protein
VNVPFKFVPTVPTAVRITTAMPAAIRPYSMAVAPDLSLRKRETRFFQCRSSRRLLRVDGQRLRSLV